MNRIARGVCSGKCHGWERLSFRMRLFLLIVRLICFLCSEVWIMRNLIRILVDYMRLMPLFLVLVAAVPGGTPHETYLPAWEQDNTLNIPWFHVCCGERLARFLRSLVLKRTTTFFDSTAVLFVSLRDFTLVAHHSSATVKYRPQLCRQTVYNGGNIFVLNSRY